MIQYVGFSLTPVIVIFSSTLTPTKRRSLRSAGRGAIQVSHATGSQSVLTPKGFRCLSPGLKPWVLFTGKRVPVAAPTTGGDTSHRHIRLDDVPERPAAMDRTTLIERLERIVGPGGVFHRPADLLVYEYDGSV